MGVTGRDLLPVVFGRISAGVTGRGMLLGVPGAGMGVSTPGRDEAALRGGCGVFVPGGGSGENIPGVGGGVCIPVGGRGEEESLTISATCITGALGGREREVAGLGGKGGAAVAVSVICSVKSSMFSYITESFMILCALEEFGRSFSYTGISGIYP